MPGGSNRLDDRNVSRGPGVDLGHICRTDGANARAVRHTHHAGRCGGVVERGEQPYVAIRSSVAMGGIGNAIERSYPQVCGWLEARGLPPAGAPFTRYNLIDMERGLEIEVGVPVASEIPGDETVVAGILPAGRYASLTHVGDYDGLVDANQALQQWAAAQGLPFAMSETQAGHRFESRLEICLKDPDHEPDPAKWETEVAYLLADG
ncbi:MAG: GyrI-like domain-containing protein [Chloroflexi bacterium]|nr:GyrI-like domain-containing protein [Chloroflexota bacterium]